MSAGGPNRGLHANGIAARYYRSQRGRYLSPDWSPSPDPVPNANLADPQSLNLYAYTGNSPLNFTDPWGHYLQAPGNCGNPCEVKAKPISGVARAEQIAAGLVALMLAQDEYRIRQIKEHPITEGVLPIALAMLGPEGEGADVVLEAVVRRGSVASRLNNAFRAAPGWPPAAGNRLHS